MSKHKYNIGDKLKSKIGEGTLVITDLFTMKNTLCYCVDVIYIGGGKPVQIKYTELYIDHFYEKTSIMKNVEYHV